MNTSSLNPKRIALAYGVAILADAIQIPFTLFFATGFLAAIGEFLVFSVDVVAGLLLTWLLGFHWMLMPSFMLEVIPGLDMFPTWTLCTAFVVRQRKSTQASSEADPLVIDVEEIKPARPARAVVPPPPLLDSRPSSPVETRRNE